MQELTPIAFLSKQGIKGKGLVPINLRKGTLGHCPSYTKVETLLVWAIISYQNRPRSQIFVGTKYEDSISNKKGFQTARV